MSPLASSAKFATALAIAVAVAAVVVSSADGTRALAITASSWLSDGPYGIE